MTVQYLIDSENVGDFWIPLLELPAKDTELIVFYTRNSPHMSYDSLIRLKESDRTVTFIKCYEGTNALDFQLVSELGYRISKDEDGSFIIVTNDTGFDAAVKYWRRRKKSVKRITGKECKNLDRRLREDLSAASREAHSSAVSARFVSDSERDEENDAGTETVRSDAVQDNDARPSRPNLRDAERAAQPDPEDGDSSEDSGYLTDAEIFDDDSDEEDPFTYDPDAEEDDETAYGKDEDDLHDEDAYDDESEVTDDDVDDSDEEAAPEDHFETDEDGESPAEYVLDAEDPDGMKETGSEQDGKFSDETGAEAVFSENDSVYMQSGTEDALEENAAGSGSELVTYAEEVKEQALQNDSGPEPEDVSAHSGSQNDAAADMAADSLLADSSSAHEDFDVTDHQSGAEEPVSAAGEEEEPAEAEEEPAAETAHRSKSRRSRSRRSKSTSRKQEQAAAADSDHSVTAAGSAQNGESSGSSKNVSAAESGKNDTAKSDTAREESGAAGEKASDSLPAPGDEEIARIVACIGAENLAELHNQLATFYGEQGKEIYLSIKNNARSIPILKPDLKQKFAYYCEIIFYRSDYAGEYPSDISEYLLSVREKLNNLNSLRYALQKHYGKEKGRRFYFLLKPFAKTMYQM